MKIVLLNGLADAEQTDAEAQWEAFRGALVAQGHDVRTFVLRDLTIRDCVGCYQCWVRTPGTCVHRDDMADVLREVIGADRVVYGSSVHLFHLSPVLKAYLDRVIPLRRAFLCIGENGRMAHPPRYETHYRTLLLAEAVPGLDDDDLGALADSCGGQGHDFCGAFRLNHPVEELCHALVRP